MTRCPQRCQQPGVLLRLVRVVALLPAVPVIVAYRARRLVGALLLSAMLGGLAAAASGCSTLTAPVQPACQDADARLWPGVGELESQGLAADPDRSDCCRPGRAMDPACAWACRRGAKQRI